MSCYHSDWMKEGLKTMHKGHGLDIHLTEKFKFRLEGSSKFKSQTNHEWLLERARSESIKFKSIKPFHPNSKTPNLATSSISNTELIGLFVYSAKSLSAKVRMNSLPFRQYNLEFMYREDTS